MTETETEIGDAAKTGKTTKTGRKTIRNEISVTIATKTGSETTRRKIARKMTRTIQTGNASAPAPNLLAGNIPGASPANIALYNAQSPYIEKYFGIPLWRKNSYGPRP